ncbi:MAG: type II toxin-antitoxin system prevent-host-death family antitoxin [Chloroflexi bacterium]|nr:type II toxin-antitoxin system prevent-host-death family antitoxin [Chloroflexota bacterium]
MLKSFSIAAARHDLAALVHELDKKPVIELTRRGKPVAMLMSLREYNRLRGAHTNFWDAYIRFQERANLRALKIEPRIWKGVRDVSPGREVDL